MSLMLECRSVDTPTMTTEISRWILYHSGSFNDTKTLPHILGLYSTVQYRELQFALSVCVVWRKTPAPTSAANKLWDKTISMLCVTVDKIESSLVFFCWVRVLPKCQNDGSVWRRKFGSVLWRDGSFLPNCLNGSSGKTYLFKLVCSLLWVVIIYV